MELFSDEYFMQEAIKEARKARDEDEVPVGAVIVWKNQIIARAHNLTETLHDVTAHAEMQAFTAAANTSGGKYLTDCTLFVTLEPCVMCAGASNWIQIDRIVYGADDDKKGFTLLKESILHSRTTVTRGVLKTECSVLLKEFFSKKRK
jgi:tRNA(adenine34) deaminase